MARGRLYIYGSLCFRVVDRGFPNLRQFRYLHAKVLHAIQISPFPQQKTCEISKIQCEYTRSIFQGLLKQGEEESSATILRYDTIRYDTIRYDVILRLSDFYVQLRKKPEKIVRA